MSSRAPERGGPRPAGLLPHGPPARWVDEVLERAEGELVCRGRIPRESPFVRGGSAPATAGLELAAQAAAVLEALERSESGGGTLPRLGYLVRVREATLAERGIPAGAPVIARVRRSGGIPPLALYEVEVRLETPDPAAGAEVCRGSLGTWAVEDGDGDAGPR